MIEKQKFMNQTRTRSLRMPSLFNHRGISKNAHVVSDFISYKVCTSLTVVQEYGFSVYFKESEYAIK